MLAGLGKVSSSVGSSLGFGEGGWGWEIRGSNGDADPISLELLRRCERGMKNCEVARKLALEGLREGL